MANDLKDEFNSNPLDRLIEAVNNDDFKTFITLLKTEFSTEDALKQVMWKLGYKGNEKAASTILSVVEDENVKKELMKEEINGQLMFACDYRDIHRIGILMSMGGQLDQNSHAALHRPFIYNDVKMFNYFIQLGLDPVVAFSRQDLKAIQGRYSSLVTQDTWKILQESMRKTYIFKGSHTGCDL